MMQNTIYINGSELQKLLPWGELVNAISSIFCSDCQMPVRHHHSLSVEGQPEATLLLMPAWVENTFLGVKIANVFPGNRQQGMDSISASYLLSSATTGRLLAILDGGELTARRTAAASVLAATYLTPKKTKRHLMVGTGRLSRHIVEAYASAFDIDRFSLWGKNQTHCQQAAQQIEALGIEVDRVAVDDLDIAVAQADIISCATLSHQPLIKGSLIKQGSHIDLIGGFTPAMREADDDVIRRASVFVDTRAGACKESGDIVIPLQTGVLKESDIQADLYDLCRKSHQGRHSESEITVFKSVGAACEDLAAAILAYQTYQSQN